jgi:hypothetical protein
VPFLLAIALSKKKAPFEMLDIPATHDSCGTEKDVFIILHDHQSHAKTADMPTPTLPLVYAQL